MSGSVDEKVYKIIQEYCIIVADLLKISVIFTGLSFYDIAKMQQY